MREDGEVSKSRRGGGMRVCGYKDYQIERVKDIGQRNIIIKIKLYILYYLYVVYYRLERQRSALV